MDSFARLPSDERQLYFEQAAAKLGMNALLIEKDFWVCWSLKRLFLLDELCDYLTFKGGTTLSKVYQVIEWFSEDIDVAIKREYLGFGGNNEPEQGGSGKEQQRRIARLKEACQAVVINQLQPQFYKALEVAFGDNADWSLSIDPADPDQQSLLFKYPPAIKANPNSYFATWVKIELGARSDHFPVENAIVTPYLSDAIPEVFTDIQARVRVLSAVRTFWEKITILHMLHYLPDDKKIAPRMSRHYYDVFCLSQSPILKQALDAVDLLARVADFKKVFFKAAWARYDEAQPGTLRLIPSDYIASELRQDYHAMQPMFFGESPSFDAILDGLRALEVCVNSTNH